MLNISQLKFKKTCFLYVFPYKKNTLQTEISSKTNESKSRGSKNKLKWFFFNFKVLILFCVLKYKFLKNYKFAKKIGENINVSICCTNITF